MAPIATSNQQTKELAKKKNTNILNNNNNNNNKIMTEAQETGYLFPSKQEISVYIDIFTWCDK